MWCEMSTSTKALSDCDTHKASSDKIRFKTSVEDWEETAPNDDIVAFVSNIIVSRLVHRGVCEMLVWRTVFMALPTTICLACRPITDWKLHSEP